MKSLKDKERVLKIAKKQELKSKKAKASRVIELVLRDESFRGTS